MIYLDLFLGFLKVGLFSFGGAYAAIPLIQETVLEYGWMDKSMLTYMIAVSESTPGSIMVNLATYVGASKGGVLGALIATLAVSLPAFIIILALTAILAKAAENKYFKAALLGLIPCMSGIILVMGLTMIIQNLFPHDTQPDIKSFIITAVLAVFYWGGRRFSSKITPIKLIILSAILGIIMYMPPLAS